MVEVVVGGGGCVAGGGGWWRVCVWWVVEASQHQHGMSTETARAHTLATIFIFMLFNAGCHAKPADGKTVKTKPKPRGAPPLPTACRHGGGWW